MMPGVIDNDQKPRVFIGSSTESSDLASALKSHLEARREAIVTHWADAFGFGQFTLDRLEALVDDFDFAAFVIAADDVIISRDQEYAGVRDNVLLEAGMFIAALGRERCYLLYPSDFSVKMPSDIKGMHLPTWSVRERANPPAALRSIAFELLRDMTSKGRRADASKQFFVTRDEVDGVFRPFRQRIGQAEHELVITGNDCLTVVQGGAPSIYKALANKPDLTVKIMCADPAADGLLEMITKVDPRFPTAADFESSLNTLISLMLPFREEFGERFGFKLLPILPSMGFFLVDPDHGGSAKVEIYTPREWEPIDSRPHFPADADPRWYEYFVMMFRNYWNMAKAPKEFEVSSSQRQPGFGGRARNREVDF
jgi:hypothetical protein